MNGVGDERALDYESPVQWLGTPISELSHQLLTADLLRALEMHER